MPPLAANSKNESESRRFLFTDYRPSRSSSSAQRRRRGFLALNSMKQPFYVPSLLNYTGGKFRLLRQIIPLFPEELSVFVEPFCGSAVVSLNTVHEFVICNDKCLPLINLYTYLQQTDLEQIVSILYEKKKTFRLTKYNKEAYFTFRNKIYNTSHYPLDLLLLLYHSFNNNIRFNTNQDFTAAFGERTFTKHHEQRLRFFVQKIIEQQWQFSSIDFREMDVEFWDEDYFVYADPPYTNGHATYSDFIGWTIQDDLDLFAFLDNLHAKGIRFALSNTIKNKGITNHFLSHWAQKYNIYPIDSNYSGASYHRLDRDKSNTEEVLITNYLPPKQSIQGTLDEFMAYKCD